MDYPKSVPGVGLVDGKFVDEDAVGGQVGSLIPSAWGNAVTDELLNVLDEAGIVPDEANVAQLLQALKIIFATLVSPAFKGEPTAPTPPEGDCSERIATTETVAAALGTIDVSGKVNRSGDVMGELSVAAGDGGADYGHFALEVREPDSWTDADGLDIKYAPKIVMHWGGVVAAQMRLTAAGVMEMVDGTGASYGAFQVGSVNATQTMTVAGNGVWHAGNFDPSSAHVSYADSAGTAGNATNWGGMPVRYAENPGQVPYYVLGIAAGQGEVSLYNAGYFALSGGQVVHAVGVTEFGSIDPGVAGGTVDLPSPWVLIGMRSLTGGSVRIYLRGVWLKNS